jgi:putative PIN family toxin of toxin-antitoxin system
MPPVPLRHGEGIGAVKLVLDTNIVLDLFVFRDERVAPLHEQLTRKEVAWLATSVMRDELAAVLGYAQIDARLRAAALLPGQVLDAFDAHAIVVGVAPAAQVICRDCDDQKFIDLAVAHGARLISKDKQVLALRRKLAAWGVAVSAQP